MLSATGTHLEQYLGLLTARQRVTAANIANADTPGYQTRDVDFSNELGAAAGMQPRVAFAEGLPAKPDGNNVSLDRETRLLAENAIRFTVASNLLRTELRSIRAAIQEGRA